jgi:hypothetical protein
MWLRPESHSPGSRGMQYTELYSNIGLTPSIPGLDINTAFHYTGPQANVCWGIGVIVVPRVDIQFESDNV